MGIAENISNSAVHGADLSSKKDLEEYFEMVVFDDKLWPLDFEKDGVKTEYLCAHIMPDKFGIYEEIHLDTRFSLKDCKYVISEKISAEEGLEIEFNSIIRQGREKDESDKFIYALLNKHHKFLKKYATENDVDLQDTKMKIHAHSGSVEGVNTVGGYVWATYGFEFSNENELEDARKAFKRFASNHDVEIADKDLKYFKYPCHFAVFDAGEKVDGNTLGKAFLLQYEWYGERRGSADEHSEPFRYQKAYHEKGKEAAKKELSKSFLALMNKYKHQNEPKENIFNKFLMLKDRFIRK